jgi:DNA-binding response OmpR family regulator
MHSILIVENDLTLARAMSQVLMNSGYLVKHVATLASAYEELSRKGYELVLVDRILDDGDGLELVSFLRDISYGTRVLMLTQRNYDMDRIKGLEDGADDYLGKPIQTQELVLRVKLLLNRQKIKDQEYLQLGELSLQPSSGRLTLADRHCRLRKREAEILACLLRMAGAVVSKDTLIEYVWQSRDDIPTHTTLEVYIRRLRIALGEQHHMLKTVRGFGYCLSV